MKKVQDYYFKKAKQENFPARSVYKLAEAQDRFRLIQRGDAVLDLGCHPGSWALYAARVAGKSGLVVGIDLQQGQVVHQPGQAPVRRLIGDIFTPEVAAELRSVRPCFNVVLSDMAPRTSGNKWHDQQQSLRLSRRALEIAELLLCPDGNFYCKVFEGEDFQEFQAEVRQRFRSAKVVKPKSSRPESREVFLLGLGYRPLVREREDEPAP